MNQNLPPLPRSGYTVNKVPLEDIDVEYVQIVGTQILLSSKLFVELEYGQVNKFWTMKDTVLLDSRNKPVVFNSMIDALNFMTEHGYTFVQAYAFTNSSKLNVFHYLLRRPR